MGSKWHFKTPITRQFFFSITHWLSYLFHEKPRWAFASFSYWFVGSLFIFWMLIPLSIMCITNYFPSLWHILLFFINRSLWLYCSYSCQTLSLFFVYFVSCLRKVTSAWVNGYVLSALFSLKSLKDLLFRFKYQIHLVLTLVNECVLEFQCCFSLCGYFWKILGRDVAWSHFCLRMDLVNIGLKTDQ